MKHANEPRTETLAALLNHEVTRAAKGSKEALGHIEALRAQLMRRGIKVGSYNPEDK